MATSWAANQTALSSLAVSENANKRASYFEMLSSISSELDFMLKDLKKNETFAPTSPKSPLVASGSNVSFESRDRSLLRSRNQLNSGTSHSTAEECTTLQPPPKTSKEHFNLLSPVPVLSCPPHPSQGSPNPSRPASQNLGSLVANFGPPPEDNALTMMTRLVHTKRIWFLPSTQRAAAAHYLQGQTIGTFVVRQARQKDKLSLTLKHPGTGKGPYIESYPIDSTLQGVKLVNEDMVFPAVDHLVAHHVHTEGVLPCRLALPMAIMAARNLREIQSLALLEEDFWKSPHSKSPTLHSKQDSFNLEFMAGKLDLTDAPAPKNPGLGHHLLEGAAEKGKEDFAPEKSICVTTSGGLYGIITGPQVIYVNADTDEKPSPRRPRSQETLPRFSWTDTRNGVERNSSHLHGQRPPSGIDRQDMRFSSASEVDFVASTDQRYPPPKFAPPPPPPGKRSPNVSMMPSVPGQSFWSQANPGMSAVEYSLPFDKPLLPPKKSRTLPACGVPQLQQQSVHTGYHQPAPANQNQGLYRAPQPTSQNSWLQRQQQQQQWPSSVVNYMAPPPPGDVHSSRCADSHHLTAAPRASTQMQNILQPIRALNCHQPETGSALPEFDPLFPPEYKQPESNANVVPRASSDALMRDYTFSDLQCDFESVRLSEANDSPPLSSKMAPMTAVSDRTRGVKVTQLIQVLDSDESIQDQETFSDHEMEEILENENRLVHLLDNSSESDSDATLPMVGIPFTENQNGNHLVASHSLELSDRLEESEFEKSREREKTEYKRNKSSFSHLKKIKQFAKKRKSRTSRRRDPNVDIQGAVLRVASDSTIGLGALVNGFIRTQEEKCETDKPDVVLRSIRQFMSGTKNYLLNKREPEVDAAIDKYVNELDLSSLEAIIEGALHQCVLEPLKSDIGMSCINEYNRNGSMALMDRNIMQAKSKSPEELGIKPNYIPPQGEDLQSIRRLFSELQEAYSPLKKLDLLLKVVSAIYNSVRDKKTGREVTHSMGADDFLPMLIYVLVQCEMMSIEIEADYMWGLLDPSMLSGEGGYYLTTLSSAICVLKQFEEETNSETQGFLTVLAATSSDPSCISLKTLPVLPGMSAHEVCRILAHRMVIDEAEADNYRLYLLKDLTELPMLDTDCPLKVKNDEEAAGLRGCRFGFRSETAKVNWPKTSGIV